MMLSIQEIHIKHRPILSCNALVGRRLSSRIAHQSVTIALTSGAGGGWWRRWVTNFKRPHWGGVGSERKPQKALQLLK